MTAPDISTAQRDEIERHCLSSLFKDSADVLRAVANGLKAEHFSDPQHRLCLLGLVAAANSDEPVPFNALCTHALANTGDGFSPADLFEIDRLQPTSADADKLTQYVINHARHSKLVAHLKVATAKALEASPVDWQETWGAVAPVLALVRDLAISHTTRSFAQQCDAYIDEQQHPEKIKLSALGLPSWDRVATPIKTHEMVALAGRPGTGKSTLALQMTNYVAADIGQTVAYFSIEMTAGEMIERLAVHRVGPDAAGDHKKSIERRIAEVERLRAVKTLRLFDDSKITVDEIDARCRLLAAEQGGLGLVVIDYLQLIAPSTDIRKEPRERQVAEMSRRLKLIPKAVGAPVLILCQLNRDCETENRPPRKSDLRESGAIEQDADRVWLLYPPIAKKRDEQIDPNQLILLQDKCRGGPANVAIKLHLNGPCHQFTPVDK